VTDHRRLLTRVRTQDVVGLQPQRDDLRLRGDEAVFFVLSKLRLRHLTLNNNDVGSNRTILVYPSVDAIEEFKIHRNSYGPEFGGASGGQINLITRAGDNQYKGSAFYFGNPFFNAKMALFVLVGLISIYPTVRFIKSI